MKRDIPIGALYLEGDTLMLRCEVFDLVAPYDGPGVKAGEHIRWNISAMKLAARQGDFGPPEDFPLALTGPEDWASGNLHEDRVQRILAHPEQLNEPVIAIEAPPPDTDKLLVFCDGQHRIIARKRRGLATVSTYAVPWALERSFRVDG